MSTSKRNEIRFIYNSISSWSLPSFISSCYYLLIVFLISIQAAHKLHPTRFSLKFHIMLSKRLSALSILGALFPVSLQAIPNCPLLGPDFPAPKNLSSSATLQSAIANISQVLSKTLPTGNTSYGLFDPVNTSYALEIFSVHDPKLIF